MANDTDSVSAATAERLPVTGQSKLDLRQTALSRRLEVTEGRLGRGGVQGHQVADRIVDEHQQVHAGARSSNQR